MLLLYDKSFFQNPGLACQESGASVAGSVLSPGRVLLAAVAGGGGPPVVVRGHAGWLPCIIVGSVICAWGGRSATRCGSVSVAAIIGITSAVGCRLAVAVARSVAAAAWGGAVSTRSVAAAGAGVSVRVSVSAAVVVARHAVLLVSEVVELSDLPVAGSVVSGTTEAVGSASVGATGSGTLSAGPRALRIVAVVLRGVAVALAASDVPVEVIELGVVDVQVENFFIVINLVTININSLKPVESHSVKNILLQFAFV